MADLIHAWKSVAEIDTKSKRGSRIHAVLSTANFDYLAGKAVEDRKEKDHDLDTRMTARFNLTQLMHGHENLILELTFSDDVIWLARISYLSEEEAPAEDLVSEIVTMSVVRERTKVPLPAVYAFNVDRGDSNRFGYPYLLMERLHGKRTRKGLIVSIPEIYRAKVARQLANMLVELSQVTFDHIGRLTTTMKGGPVTVRQSQNEGLHIASPTMTSLEYFYGQRYAENKIILEGHPNDVEWNTACWILTIGQAHLIIPDLVRGPFPLCHQDLHTGNFLFDDNFNITGIIDWANAHVAPLEDLCVLLDFTVYDEENEQRRKHVQEFRDATVQELERISKRTGCTSAHHMALYLASYRSELNACQRKYRTSEALDAAKDFAKIIYGTTMDWQQLVHCYGTLPFPKMSD